MQHGGGERAITLVVVVHALFCVGWLVQDPRSISTMDREVMLATYDARPESNARFVHGDRAGVRHVGELVDPHRVRLAANGRIAPVEEILANWGPSYVCRPGKAGRAKH